jgi:uncharacterized protein YecE (DUF72 family)
MRIYAGTSGFSYKEWKGAFYPDDLPAKSFLQYYASKLPSVEINNTFYRMPRASVLEAWAEQVPEGFRFVIKASQRITHRKRLKDTQEETGYLLRNLEALGDRLGVVLYQLPPNLKLDLDRLKSFLDTLPRPERAAFEFRHQSWFTDEVYAALRAAGSALCVADTDEGDLEVDVLGTTDWGYLRLRRESYTDPELTTWIERIGAQGWNTAYVFFKHEDDAAGPLMALRFLELAQRTS